MQRRLQRRACDLPVEPVTCTMVSGSGGSSLSANAPQRDKKRDSAIPLSRLQCGSPYSCSEPGIICVACSSGVFCISCGFEGSPGEDSYCPSLSLCSGLLFRPRSILLYLLWVCTTATVWENTLPPGLHAVSALEELS